MLKKKKKNIPKSRPFKGLTQLTSPLQVESWTASPQRFVEDEDDDSFSYSVRISAQDLLLVRTEPGWRAMEGRPAKCPCVRSSCSSPPFPRH